MTLGAERNTSSPTLPKSIQTQDVSSATARVEHEQTFWRIVRGNDLHSKGDQVASLTQLTVPVQLNQVLMSAVGGAYLSVASTYDCTCGFLLQGPLGFPW